MKKFLVLLTFIFSLFVISCASNGEKSPSTNNIEPPSESTLTNENEPETETTETSGENTNTEETDNTITNENVIPEFTTVAESYPELEELLEPEVITLDPPELPPELPEENAAVTTLEPVEAELPVETTVANETELPNENTIQNGDETKLANDNEIQNEDDVIDITDDDASAKEVIETNIEVISPSRKITLKIYEFLDITYPGSGWVYMGLTDGSKDLSYVGRKLGSSDTKFILQARAAGTKIIHFYKNDSLQKQYVDDYIEVEILDEKGSNKTHITAPDYKPAIPSKAKKIINDNNAKKELPKEKPVPQEEAETVTKVETKPEVKEVKTETKVVSKPAAKIESKVEQKKETKIEKIEETQKTETNQLKEKEENNQPDQTIDLNVLLQEAQLLYNEKEYKKAKEKVELFIEISTQKQDEALFLKGQILEAKSDIQNIKNAIAAYTTLTKNYPASRYWDDANKRIIYLKRFYLEVR